MHFEKVSFEQWKKDAINLWSYDNDKLLEIYNAEEFLVDAGVGNFYSKHIL